MLGEKFENKITEQEKENEEIREHGAKMVDLIGKFDNLLE